MAQFEESGRAYASLRDWFGHSRLNPTQPTALIVIQRSATVPKLSAHLTRCRYECLERRHQGQGFWHRLSFTYSRNTPAPLRLCFWDGNLRSRGSLEQIRCDGRQIGYNLGPGRHHPYLEIQSDIVVAHAVMEGVRPGKRLGFSEESRKIVELCWLEDRNARPRIDFVLSWSNNTT